MPEEVYYVSIATNVCSHSGAASSTPDVIFMTSLHVALTCFAIAEIVECYRRGDRCKLCAKDHFLLEHTAKHRTLSLQCSSQRQPPSVSQATIDSSPPIPHPVIGLEPSSHYPSHFPHFPCTYAIRTSSCAQRALSRAIARRKFLHEPMFWEKTKRSDVGQDGKLQRRTVTGPGLEWIGAFILLLSQRA